MVIEQSNRGLGAAESSPGAGARARVGIPRIAERRQRHYPCTDRADDEGAGMTAQARLDVRCSPILKRLR
jgi:hypothetical protein